MTYTQVEIAAAASYILTNSESKVILFYGEMGVGKTTLIKEICMQLGATDIAASPTFSIVNEYEAKEDVIYHFDFYRINDPNEALDLGFEDYVYSDEWVFIEWPEKISLLLPDDAQKVLISKNQDGSRTLQLALDAS